MIEMNGTSYRLGLLDTCILSKILTSPDYERQGFFKLFFDPSPIIIPCVTIWSVLELRQKSELYKNFIDFFSVIPFSMLKTPDLLLADEYKHYPFFNKIDPILFTFSMLKPKSESLTLFLNKVFSNKEVKRAEKNWKNKWKQEKLNSILSLKSNFISNNKNLNSSDAKRFLNEALPQYITYQNPSWIKEKLDKNEEIIFDAFPSAKAALYTVFYRFYVANRKPEVQDVFDILINNIVPYLDYVVTENFQSDILMKIKKADKQFAHLEIKSIRHLR
ncbi:MAG: hypothetical protein MUP85_03630 [Candidatus Lokiarchaeota archaeon]|nr:hypothetical protein [Candidatus Lokiarchaeota archaeon]